MKELETIQFGVKSITTYEISYEDFLNFCENKSNISLFGLKLNEKYTKKYVANILLDKFFNTIIDTHFYYNVCSKENKDDLKKLQDEFIQEEINNNFNKWFTFTKTTLPKLKKGEWDMEDLTIDYSLTINKNIDYLVINEAYSKFMYKHNNKAILKEYYNYIELIK